MDKFKLPNRLNGSTSSVWNEFQGLTSKCETIDLSTGSPDFLAPKCITDTLAKVVTSKKQLFNQYTRGFGHPRLVKAISRLYSKIINRKINSNEEILITSGAYEGLYVSILGHIDKNDEVIIIEPFFDCYEPMVKMAGGIPVFIPLKPIKSDYCISSADWILDENQLENLFNKKTKMIILNTPHNPTGKVFNKSELEKIAELCRKWDVLCISDEVYEWIVFDNQKHVRICTLPGMWERTITIGSAGKTFLVTGWKIGWAYGPASIMANLKVVHESCVHSCITPIQETIAITFENAFNNFETQYCYFKNLSREIELKRNFMLEILRGSGLKAIRPEGGFFLLADWSSLANIDLNQEQDKYLDFRFAKWMTKELGIKCIPPSAFYSEPNKLLGENLVRLCFMKDMETLKKSSKVLKQLKPKSED